MAVKTQRILTKKFKEYDPMSIEGYISLGGFKQFENCLNRKSEDVIEDIKKSGIRGRGGAGYPTGIKLEQSKVVPGEKKYIICNADEGEPGTYKDRQFIEFDPYSIVEGMLISALVADATDGYIYVREEYFHLHGLLHNAIQKTQEAGYLGTNIKGSGFNFSLEVFSGAGAYVCGEGGALIESIEGNPGKPRKKPPYTKVRGLFQLPTLVMNVETLAAIPAVLEFGVEKYMKLGTPDSIGTKVISVSGKVNKPGAFEVEFGASLNDIINELCGGMKDGAKPKFLQIGGASGPIVPAHEFDLRLCYQELWEHGFDVGSGAIVVADESVRLVDYLETVYEFFLDESCGKCTPCREGNRQITHILGRIAHGEHDDALIAKAEKYARLMKEVSFCGLGKTANAPLLSAIKNMRESFFE
ncbi:MULTISPECIES: NADH-quinone oxidoreductase subunit F [unclassified Fusibacter]|uniref:complex I 51 kDa subunit family protein n=1 Tax=unclassified Fusibacter TaxID=2624464 RepID=UPI0010107774|nr:MULTISPECIES: NADH-ubiquinone oxidoreductase-F iron-sulfur binding region domain-containing protein [unclassified Fusibacter]MCK8059262.1 SLBB domain-containing protein [Fusibacter sp. A2]NPE21274.1 NADH-quinone oxidoreductase subunit F [Fusibacter sp. A1]RXV62539.1 NADH-quinone oxidoreductase subunit F [Fusibacter sp. A1]